MDENYEKAKKRVNQLKGFYTSLIVYIVVIIFLAVVNYLTSPGIWWFLIVAFIWGILLLLREFLYIENEDYSLKNGKIKKLKSTWNRMTNKKKLVK